MTLIARFLLLVLPVAACDLGQAPLPLNPPMDPPALAELAAETSRYEWSVRLELDLPDELPAVRWFAGCLEYEPWFMKPEWVGGCIGGRYFADADEIHVAYHPSPRRTGLAHELLHWSLYHGLGDANSGHDLPIWAEVVEVNRRLAGD